MPGSFFLIFAVQLNNLQVAVKTPTNFLDWLKHCFQDLTALGDKSVENDLDQGR